MRWRLISVFMAITLLVVLVQDIPLGSYLVRVERDRLATSLERDAFLLSGRAQQLLETGGPAPGTVAAAVRDYGQASGARVVVVDRSGTAVATSDDDQSATGASYLSRPRFPPRSPARSPRASGTRTRWGSTWFTSPFLS